VESSEPHAHTITFPGRWDSGPVDSGEEASAYFPQPGTYRYDCRFHPYSMQGEVYVY